MREEIEKLAEYTKKAYEKGYVGGSGGNSSVRFGDEVYITPTGIALDEVMADTLVRVRLKTGEVLSANGGKPSKELPMHLAIYQARPDLNAIIHLHPVDCIAATLLLDEDELLPCYVPGHVKKIKRPPVEEYFPAGSPELAVNTMMLFEKNDGVFLKRHGIIAGGKDVRTAYLHCEDMIDASRIHLRLRGFGALNEERIQQLLK